MNSSECKKGAVCENKKTAPTIHWIIDQTIELGEWQKTEEECVWDEILENDRCN